MQTHQRLNIKYHCTRHSCNSSISSSTSPSLSSLHISSHISFISSDNTSLKKRCLSTVQFNYNGLLIPRPTSPRRASLAYRKNAKGPQCTRHHYFSRRARLVPARRVLATPAQNQELRVVACSVAGYWDWDDDRRVWHGEMVEWES